MQAHVIMSVVAEKYFQSEHLHSECIQFDLKHIQFEQHIQSRQLFFFSNLDIIIRQLSLDFIIKRSNDSQDPRRSRDWQYSTSPVRNLLYGLLHMNL